MQACCSSSYSVAECVIVDIISLSILFFLTVLTATCSFQHLLRLFLSVSAQQMTKYKTQSWNFVLWKNIADFAFSVASRLF